MGEGMPSRRRQAVSLVMIILVVGVVIFGALFALTMFANVDVGYAMVLVDPWANTISEPTLGPTFIVKAPWVQPITIMIATDTLGMWGTGDPTADLPTVKVFSKDQLEIEISILLRWNLDTSKVKQLYENLPQRNWKRDVIASIAREEIRLVAKDFTTIQTIEQREVVKEAIITAIRIRLESEESLAGAIQNLAFELRNIGYPASYTAAIEAKLVAEQQQIQAEFERQKTLILANATAQAVIIESRAEAEAKVIVANGTRESIELILEASGADVSNSTRITELFLWVETLKQIAPDIDMFLMGTGQDGLPIIIQPQP